MVTKKWAFVKRNKSVNVVPLFEQPPLIRRDEMDRWDEGSTVERNN
jgi:hypothetical protein